MMSKTMMSWSSGKDSAWALYQLQQSQQADIQGLFCTVNKQFSRVAMHGVRIELLYKQAESLGLPLEIIEIPYPCSNAEYERIMGEFVEGAIRNKIEQFAFGDLYLEDIRHYREEKLKDTGIKAVFPIWGMSTQELATEMIDSGLKTVISCIDPGKLPDRLAGREFNKEFLYSLPEGTDPCGENGEFHSFVYDGPMFTYPLQITTGETVRRDGFVYVDIL